MNIPEEGWGMFDSLTCEHPMLADIEDWMIPPFPQCLIDAGVYNTRLKEEG